MSMVFIQTPSHEQQQHEKDNSEKNNIIISNENLNLSLLAYSLNLVNSKRGELFVYFLFFLRLHNLHHYYFTTTSTHSSSILSEIISYSPTAPLRILWKGTEFFRNVVSKEIAAQASFLRFWTFIHSHIFSLPFSLYLSLLFHISNSGYDKQKGFFLSKNHLYYIIVRCPLSLLIPYWGFKIYLYSYNIQGFIDVRISRHLYRVFCDSNSSIIVWPNIANV